MTPKTRSAGNTLGIIEINPAVTLPLPIATDDHQASNTREIVDGGGARMIRQPVQTHDDIASAFDGITYSKGGGVLAMFEHFMGEEDFRAGIRAYLAARPYGSATAADQHIRRIALCELGGIEVVNPSTIVVGEVAALDVLRTAVAAVTEGAVP